MIPPAKLGAHLNTIGTLAAFIGLVFFNADKTFAVEKALHVHWESAELTVLARAIGQELSKEIVTGSSNVTLNGEVGGEPFIAKGLNFSVAVGETDAKFNGSTGILSKIQLTDLVIHFDQIQFLKSPGKTCRNVTVSTGSNLLSLKLELKPSVEYGKLHFNHSRMDFAPNPQFFQISSLGNCGISAYSEQLARKLGLFATVALKHPIVNDLSVRAKETIANHFREINQSLIGTFSLSNLLTSNGKLSANIQLIPEAVVVGPKSIDIMLGAEFSFAPEETAPEQHHQQTTDQSTARLKNEIHSNSWIGFTDRFLSGVASAANDYGIFSPTLNAKTMPKLTDLLTANALQALTPDARKRFSGTEPLSIRFGKAQKISATYQPFGPGEIPIIDMLLTDIDIAIDVAGTHYLSTTNSMQFRFKASIGQNSNKLSLEMIDAKSKVTSYNFSKDLNPRPRDRSFDRSGFTGYLKNFLTNSRGATQGNSGLMLPSIEIGSYYFSWQSVRMLDQMLILETSLETE
jgi:hypothetical protein